MGDPVTTGLIVASLAGTTAQVEAGRSARKQTVRTQNKAESASRAVEGQQKEKGVQEQEKLKQQQARQKQKGQLAAGSAGRSGTILGGASAGNVGNQAQSGGGKTLLGS